MRVDCKQEVAEVWGKGQFGDEGLERGGVDRDFLELCFEDFTGLKGVLAHAIVEEMNVFYSHFLVNYFFHYFGDL